MEETKQASQQELVQEAVNQMVQEELEREEKPEVPKAEQEGMADEAISEEAISAEGLETEAEVERSREEAEQPENMKSFFRKKEKKDKAQEQIAELNDKLRRQMAEFDNFRKRTEKEKSYMFETGARSVIEKILPVVDNFERGLEAISEEDKENAFVQGMEKVYKQLIDELLAMGVKPIEAVGKEFNLDFHNAVIQVASEEHESGVVAQELLKGYTYRDNVVRHSMVGVAE